MSATIPPLDDVEARFFTLQLADDRHPCTCSRCSKLVDDCTCIGDEMRAWLAAHDDDDDGEVEYEYRCSRVAGVGQLIDRINQRIASTSAMPLRVLDPQRWRAHRRAQREARKRRRLRRARRGW